MEREGLPRSIEVPVAAMLALLTAPVLALAALLVYVVDGRPVMLRRDRVGLRGQPLQLLKLRTMRRDADALLERHVGASAAARDEWRRFHRLVDDPRLLPGIGRLLRRLSIDELPQLWQVVVGEMALVGPRPLERELVDRMPDGIRARRAAVRPGLTGLWQVSGRSELGIDDMLALDMQYLEARGLGLDCRILLSTPLAILGGRGAY